ncbi:MAG: methyltransferase domain-containing protein [Bdellovibrionales bacterium]|nr:methyltransferase domain-containing protein [Bdellovibrionales bacterium]
MTQLDYRKMNTGETLTPNLSFGPVESHLPTRQSKDWRLHFAKQLQGHGLEVGPMDRPLPRHPGSSVDYLDRWSVEQHKRSGAVQSKRLLVQPHKIDDVEELLSVRDGSYDFAAAACVLEQVRSPIRAIASLLRVVKPGGSVYLVFSDGSLITGCRRKICTLEHAVLDFNEPSVVRDFEHFLDYVVKERGLRGVGALEAADEIAAENPPVELHRFAPDLTLEILRWTAKNAAPLEIVSGPHQAPAENEFHFMLRKPN